MRLAAALLVTVSAASAQSLPEPQREPSAPAAQETITPPKLIAATPAPYPAGASGAARVVLLVEVDLQGLPRNVSVVSQPQPLFDEAALKVSDTLRFEPAKRGETPIAVRIQYAVNFTAPPAPPPLKSSEMSVNLEGQLRERGTRRKLQGIEIQAGNEAAVTDAEGHFELRGLTEETPVVIVIAAPGFRRYEREETIARHKKLTVEYRLQPLETSQFEATVEGDRQRHEISETTIDRSEFQVIPGSQGDPLKVIEDLPGVARTSPIGGGLLVIRGSDPGDSLVYLDGEPIPLLYHFGAISSTFNPDLLEAIDYIPGNFSTRYGDLIGGLVDVRQRKLREEPHGYANVNLLEASVLLESAIPEIPGLSFAIAGRRSYIDIILRGFVPKGGDIGLTVAPRYYDAQFRLDYKPPGGKHQFSLLALSSDDTLGLLVQRPLDQDPNLSGSIDAETGFQQIRLKHEWRSEKTSISTVAMYERLFISFVAGPSSFGVIGHDLFLRSTLSHEVSDTFGLGAGLDFANRRLGISAVFRQSILFREGDFNSQGPRPDDPYITVPPKLFNRFSPGVWTELRWRPLPGLLLTPGLRADLYRYSPSQPNETGTVTPRFTARYDFSESVAFKAGIGLYSQGARNGDSVVPFGNPFIAPEQAWQATLGTEIKPLRGFSLGVEGFYKGLWDLIVNTPSGSPYTLDNSGTGRVFGLEVLLRKELSERLFGWISYTLSRSDRIDRPGEPRRLFDFDQTHNLTTVVSYKIGAGWQAGARMRLISGNPDTPVIGSRYLANFDVYLPIYGPTNSQRLPLFHQLDVRIDKTWTFDKWLLDAYLDVLNTYNHRSIEGSAYSYDFSEKAFFQGLPIIPTLGVKGSF